jgi:nicotinamidase-related amidase
MSADKPSRDPSLDGNAPDTSPLALVLIDTISDMEFPGGESLFQFALPAARRIAALKRRAKACGIPVVYANDNFGRWRSDFREVVEHCSREGARGRPIVELLRPEEDDYFVLKPKHSAFYATTFDLLLNYLGSRRLIMTGFSGDICVLLSASDAYMRDFRVNVPSDCVASVAAPYSARGLAYMRRVLDVDTSASDELDLQRLLAQMRE